MQLDEEEEEKEEDELESEFILELRRLRRPPSPISEDPAIEAEAATEAWPSSSPSSFASLLLSPPSRLIRWSARDDEDDDGCKSELASHPRRKRPSEDSTVAPWPRPDVLAIEAEGTADAANGTEDVKEDCDEAAGPSLLERLRRCNLGAPSSIRRFSGRAGLERLRFRPGLRLPSEGGMESFPCEGRKSIRIWRWAAAAGG